MDSLPDEVIFDILYNTEDEIIMNFRQTNLFYQNLCNDVYFWSQRIVENTKYSRLLFEELWKDIEKCKEQSMTGPDIFKNIIRDKTSDPLNYLYVDYMPNPLYISFLKDLCVDLNTPGTNIESYMESAVTSIIELYKFLRLKHSWVNKCSYILRAGVNKGACCNRKLRFSAVLCPRHYTRLKKYF